MMFKSYASREVGTVGSDEGNAEKEVFATMTGKQERLGDQTVSEPHIRSSDETTAVNLQKWLASDNVSKEEDISTRSGGGNLCGDFIKKISARPNSHWLSATKKVDNDGGIDATGSSSCSKVRWIVGEDSGSGTQESVLFSAEKSQDDDAESQSSSFQLVDEPDCNY